jgi:hypothetical protein
MVIVLSGALPVFQYQSRGTVIIPLLKQRPSKACLSLGRDKDASLATRQHPCDRVVVVTYHPESAPLSRGVRLTLHEF